MTEIALSYDARWWVPVDLEADPKDWVPAVVQARWAEERLPRNKRVLKASVGAVIAVVEAIQDGDPPPFLSLLLFPRADGGILAAATVRMEYPDEPLTQQDLLAELLLPAEMLEMPAEVRAVDTEGGPALRIHQRYRLPADAHVEIVSDSLVYVWSTVDEDDDPLIVTFSTALEDLVHAEEIYELFDQAAVTLAVVHD